MVNLSEEKNISLEKELKGKEVELKGKEAELKGKEAELKIKETDLERKNVEIKELISAKEALKIDISETNKKGVHLEKQLIAPLKEENRILQKEKLTLERNLEESNGQLVTYKQKVEILEKGIAESAKSQVNIIILVLVINFEPFFKTNEAQ
jgi:predicted  nucleic acid-binding Zn-ribbon protein